MSSTGVLYFHNCLVVSTRALISVTAIQTDYFCGEILIYKHCVVYPEAILLQIEEAKHLAFPLPQYDIGDFAAALVSVMKNSP